MNDLPSLSVHRPITWIMLSLATALFGLFSLSRLDLDMLPEIELPVIAVITSWQGADPAAVEQLVTRPIEEAMETVPGIDEVTSTSSQGSSLVLATFQWDGNMRETEQDVRKELDLRALDALPEGVDRPVVFAFDPSLSPVVFLTVNAPGSPDAVRRLAEDDIAPRLGRLPGVAAAEVLGGADREIGVQLLPEWLTAYGIGPTQVAGSVQAGDARAPGGQIRHGSVEIGVVTEGELTTLDQIREVVVGQAGGAPIRVADVANVEDGLEEITHVVRAEGQPAVMLAVRKQSDANTVQVVREVKRELARMEGDLPDGVKLGILMDQAEPILGSLSNLASSALAALLATGLVLLSFLRNWRSSSAVLVSIPLSMMVTFAVMDTVGVTLNIISMAGLALAVGMLVDNSIVVVENIFVRLSEGRPLKEASIQGTGEVAMPIVASTLTTLSVFVPVLFVPGIAGQLFRDMALTICISLSSSLVVTLTVVPLLASLGLRDRAPRTFERLVGWLTGWVEPLGRAYEAWIPRLLARPGRVMALAAALFAATLALTPMLGVDFLPVTDRAMIEYTVKTAPGSSMQATDAIFRKLEALAEAQVPEARTISIEHGTPGGVMAALGGGTNEGQIRIGLVPVSERARSQQDIETALQPHFDAIPGVEVRIRPMALGATGDVLVRVSMEDLERLREYGAELQRRIEALPEAAAVEFDLAEGRTELKVYLDRDQLQRLGLTASDVTGAIATTYMGVEVARIQDGEHEIPVRVRAHPDARTDLNRLQEVPIVTPRGQTVPLSAVAAIQTGVGPTAIARVDQERTGTLSVTLGQASLGELLSAVEGVLADTPPPADAKVQIGGSAEDLQESFMALGLAIVVAVVLVYMVMASQFESLVEPFVILVSIPLALTGAILGLLLTGTTLQVTALIGVVLLAGIVVNNGILLIDVLKTNRSRGDDLVTAAGAAGRARLRPILMTSLTTILGMTPLALEMGQGAEMWAPMARAVIGGMAASTVLTLVVVPAAYVVTSRIVDRGKRSEPPAALANPTPSVA